MTRHPRPVDLARLALGAIAVTAPDRVLTVTRARGGTGPRRAVRILGARYVVQSGAGLLLARPWTPRADAAVDAVHAVTMLGAAARWPAHRGLALLSAAAGTVLAVVDLREEVR